MPRSTTKIQRQALNAGPEYNTDWVSVVREVRKVNSYVQEMREWTRWKEKDFRLGIEKGWLSPLLQERMVFPFGLTSGDRSFYRWLSFNDEQGYIELNRAERDLGRKLSQMAKAVHEGDVGEALAQSRFLKPYLDDTEKVFNRVLARVHPAKFTYKGLTITNEYRMSEPLVKICLDAIAAMLAIFKRRSVDGLLVSSVREIRLIPSATWTSATGGDSHGQYDSSKKRITITGDALRSQGVGHFMKNWVHEIFLHEFGHHVHLSGMTSEAKSFWNEGWSEVWKAENSVSDRKQERELETAIIDRKVIQKFWKTFKAAGFKAQQAAGQFKGMEAQKFWIWLQRGQFVNKRLNLTKVGKDRTAFLRSYPAGKDEWARKFEKDRRVLYNDFFGDFFEEGRSRYEEEYEDILRSLRVKDVIADYAKDIYLQPEEIELVKDSDLDLMKAESTVEQRKNDLGIPSSYGKTNVKEDFAETFVLWMVAPNKLHPVAQWRMGRSMWLSGYGGKPIMRLGMAQRVASAHQYGLREVGEAFLGRKYEMPLSKDTFIHFTTADRAEAIVASGKLLMRPPHPKFGTDTVNAVSATYGVWQPGVQTTHIDRGDLVAVLFQTSTVPKYGYVEEVVWDRDVKLQNPRIVSAQKAAGMLKRSPVQIDDGDQVVYR